MKTKILFIFLTSILFYSNFSLATDVEKNTAQIQALDKITGRVSEINIPVNGMVNFGSFSIVVRSCKTRPIEETPDNFAFIDIVDKTLQGEEINIFKGWMISSSPATNAVEHPIFDVWLLKCIDTNVNKKLLLSEKQLAERDKIPSSQFASNQNQEKNYSEKATDVTEPIIEIEAEQQPNEDENNTFSEIEFSYDEEVIDNNEDTNNNTDDSTTNGQEEILQN